MFFKSQSAQTGFAHLLLLVAGIGVLIFLLIATLAPFRNNLLSSLFRKSFTFAAGPNDWPQIGHDPQHTGYSAEILGTAFATKWTYPFQPERLNSQVQPIIASGMVFIGTEMGNIYALDAVNPDPLSPTKGKVLWKYPIGSPILSTVAVDNGKIYATSLDGALYILNSDGSLFKKVQLTSRVGITASPIVADGKVLVGGRDGIFYAVDSTTGNLVWKYDVGVPILQTAAWNNGKVFFGAMDLYFYALNSSPTNVNDPATILAWKSTQLYGMDFKDYWPMVTQGKVLVRPQSRRSWREAYNFPKLSFPLGPFTTTDWTWVASNSAALISGNAATIPEFINIQNTKITAYKANPASYDKNLFIFDEDSGQESVVAPHFANMTMHGTTAPGCVDRDMNVVEPILFNTSGWGRLDLDFQVTPTVKEPRFVDVLYDGLDTAGNQFINTHNTMRAKGFGNPDENMAVSCSQNLIIATHFSDAGISANFAGYFDLNNRKWYSLPKGVTKNEMLTNTQSPGTVPAAISNGLVYTTSADELIVRKTN